MSANTDLNMTNPNIFDFATSELSQDAALAYMLAWADPKYRKSHPKLNSLGEELLRALIASAAVGMGKPDSLANLPIEKVKVGTQRKRIDVWAEVNDEIFLIIEDKTSTEEHSKQIGRYIETASEYKTDGGQPWPEVLAVYVKTGNESTAHRLKSAPCGVFMREDLLTVLGNTTATGNSIIEEFRRYLENWQQATMEFQSAAIDRWDWSAIEGYYLALSAWIRDENSDYPVDADLAADWKYVANPSGGFLGFWWHWRESAAHGCWMYLQIDQGTRLQIRASDATDEAGKETKVHSDLLWSLLSAVEEAATKSQFASIHIEKAGRFGGGGTAGVAEVLFNDAKESYLAGDSRGVLDWEESKRRISLAMELLDVACRDSSPVESS